MINNNLLYSIGGLFAFGVYNSYINTRFQYLENKIKDIEYTHYKECLETQDQIKTGSR